MNDYIFIKQDYALEEIKELKTKNEHFLFLAETYLKKTLSANDIRSVIFIIEELHFTENLFDYLLQYCAQRNKKDFRYIEKVAINWAENDVNTPRQAANFTNSILCDSIRKETATDIINQACKEMCDKFCSYRSTKDDNGKCKVIKEGRECPLTRIV